MWEISKIFGGDYPQHPLEFHEIAARAVLVYLFGLAAVRIGKSRLLSHATPLDALVVIILGSLLSRAMTGPASLSATIVSSIALVLLHAVFTAAAFRWHPLGNLIKGHSRPLVRDGEILWENMRKSHISPHDLEEALRLNGGVENVKEVRLAMKERNGEISVVPRCPEPRILESDVRQGVQHIRIELTL